MGGLKPWEKIIQKNCMMNTCIADSWPENQTDQTPQIFVWQNLLLSFYGNAGD